MPLEGGASGGGALALPIGKASFPAHVCLLLVYLIKLKIVASKPFGDCTEPANLDGLYKERVKNMENIYIKFKKSMGKLNSETSLHECESLVWLAQRYYSHYIQYQKLEPVVPKLSNIYNLKGTNGSSLLRDGQIDIRYRPFLDFYFRCTQPTNTYKIITKHRHSELDYLEAEYGLSKYKIGNHNLYEWINISCKKAARIYKKRGKVELWMDNIKEAAQLYKRYSEFKRLDEEECFNSVFSPDFVNLLINVMEMNEGLLVFWAAPVRAQLCKEEEGGRNINNKAWKWCYGRDFRETLSEIQNKINDIKQLDKIMKDFHSISRQLAEIEKEIL